MYALTYHVRQQIAAKGFSVADVLAAAVNPTVTYENYRYPGQERHIRNGIVVVVDPKQEKIITVYANVVETEQRPDQKDADAVKHFTDRAKREQKRRERQQRDRAFTASLKGKK